MKQSIPKSSIYVPIILLSLIWLTFLLQHLGLGRFNCYGIVPRNLLGLRGVILAPLFHSGWQHIINNSIPLAVLSFFAVMFYKRIAYYVIVFGWILTGLLVWLIGNIYPGDSIGCHIGASGIVYLLASYVFFSGVFKKSRNLIAISLIVVFFYGSMIWGVFPEEFFPNFFKQDANPISWESHLSGFLVGLFFAFIGRNYGDKPQPYSWETQIQPDAREQWLWEKYKETLSDEERLALEEKYGEITEKQESEVSSDENQLPKNTSDNSDGYWFQNHS